MLFLRGWWYTIYVLYRSGLSPFYCGGYRYPLITMVSLEERLVVFPFLLVSGLASPLFYVLVEHGHIFQKGDTFRHHNYAKNKLLSCLRILSTLFQLLDQSGNGLRGERNPYHLHGIFFYVDFSIAP